MMKEAYAQSIECEEPCEGRLSRTVLWEGEGETPSLYSTLSFSCPLSYSVSDWLDVMKGNTTAADAILDRLVHTSVRFELKGSSLRQKSNQKCTESEKND